jgi:hypothetical protein
VTLSPGETKTVPVELPLTATGTVIARVSVLDGTGRTIDSSDMPLSSLAYPAQATKPAARERFGGSFAGGTGCLDKMQRLGFGWTRWWPRGKWHSFEPEEGRYQWRDKDFEAAFSRGMSCHIVLYGKPKWAMDKSSPLPKDMRWKGDDPRWEDYGVETSWDRYVKAAVEHFRGKPVVFQIANEPGHEKGWHSIKDAYVKFNLRTAHLIKMTDPKARVSLNNVYTNPSPPNAALLKTKELQDFDIWSWHDYRTGWLLDARGVKRIRQMLDEAGGKHLEIWFTEGWMFTNTLVDQPTACTGLSSVESTHAAVNSIAEMSASGHDKVVMFHLLYETHGQSFWDYSGPGVMLWDWYGYPLPTLAAWNSLNHHIGISDSVGLVQPRGASFAIFQDHRNQRGVMIAYADPKAKEDATVRLPVTGLVAEDIMGNPVRILDDRLVLSKTGRPVVLYSKDRTPGKDLYAALEPLDRKHLGFVETVAGVTTYRLPDRWDGTRKGTSQGNPALSDGHPMWRIDRLYPNDRIIPANYTPMVWGNQVWTAPDHTHGGHPSASVQNGSIRFGTMGPWDGELSFKKQGALSFIVPEGGTYRVQATAQSRPWGGSKGVAKLYVMKRDEQRVGLVKTFDLPPTNHPVQVALEVDAGPGHEIVFLVEMPAHNNSSNISLNDLAITRQ